MLIFDFDGTIADTSTIIMASLTKNAQKYGFEKTENLQDDIKSIDIQTLMQSLNLSSEQLTSFINAIKNDVACDLVKKAHPCGDIINNLIILHNRGTKMFIVTSNTLSAVKQWLTSHNIAALFHRIYADVELFAKTQTLNQLLSEFHNHPTKAIYIGDEVRDIQAAQKANIASAAVTWGMTSQELLQKYNPDYILSSPSELLTL